MSKDAPKDTEKTLTSGYIGQGPKVDEFERKLSVLFGNRIVTTNSATSAEHLALHLLKKPSDDFYGRPWAGLEPGDEILASPLTCTATNWPILANGFKIKWVDVDPDNLNIDLDDLQRKISTKTKAAMFVHWGGYPVDLDKLKGIREKYLEYYGATFPIIEDCAHALGSEYKGKLIGNHGNICTFSFQAIKQVTSVDGGMLVVPNDELFKRGKLLRWYGIDRETERQDFRCEEDILEWGFKFHMNDVSATVGLSNLPHMEMIVSRHQENADYYNEALHGVGGVTLLENEPDRKSAYWLYTIKVERQADFMKYMADCGIMVSRVHERNDIHSTVRDFRVMLPNLDEVVRQMICIPVGWWVTKANREYIVDCIKKGW